MRTTDGQQRAHKNARRNRLTAIEAQNAGKYQAANARCMNLCRIQGTHYTYTHAHTFLKSHAFLLWLFCRIDFDCERLAQVAWHKNKKWLPHEHAAQQQDAIWQLTQCALGTSFVVGICIDSIFPKIILQSISIHYRFRFVGCWIIERTIVRPQKQISNARAGGAI